MPARRRPDQEPTLSIFPERIHIGDRFIEADIGDEEREWEVISRPVTFKKGHEVRARVQRPGDPGTAREKYWAAHVKITVRRGTAVQEEKQDLERRNAHLARQLEEMRKKIPQGTSTS